MRPFICLGLGLGRRLEDLFDSEKLRPGGRLVGCKSWASESFASFSSLRKLVVNRAPCSLPLSKLSLAPFAT